MDIPELVDKFTDFLHTIEDASIADAVTLIMVLTSKMRTVLTVQELHDLVHEVIQDTEEALQAKLHGPEGSSIMLAEMWRDVEGGEDMLRAMFKGTPDTFPAEWADGS